MTTIRKPDDGGMKSFSFDHSYWSFDKSDPNYAGQQRLYDDLGVELLNHSFSGYNTCIVACKFFLLLFLLLFVFFSFFCASCLVVVEVCGQVGHTTPFSVERIPRKGEKRGKNT